MEHPRGNSGEYVVYRGQLVLLLLEGIGWWGRYLLSNATVHNAIL